MAVITNRLPVANHHYREGNVESKEYINANAQLIVPRSSLLKNLFEHENEFWPPKTNHTQPRIMRYLRDGRMGKFSALYIIEGFRQNNQKLFFVNTKFFQVGK